MFTSDYVSGKLNWNSACNRAVGAGSMNTATSSGKKMPNEDVASNLDTLLTKMQDDNEDSNAPLEEFKDNLEKGKSGGGRKKKMCKKGGGITARGEEEISSYDKIQRIYDDLEKTLPSQQIHADNPYDLIREGRMPQKKTRRVIPHV